MPASFTKEPLRNTTADDTKSVMLTQKTLLTPEEKKLCAEWMKDAGWCYQAEMSAFRMADTYYRKSSNGWSYPVHFDHNDAALCVVEMQERGEYFFFMDAARESWLSEENISDYGLFAWLFTTNSGEATNFFRSMFQWVKEKKNNVAHNCGADSYIGEQNHDPNGRFFNPR